MDKLSFVTSNKNWMEGHRLRLQLIKYFRSVQYDYDLYGKLVGYKVAFTKADGGSKYLSKPTLFLAGFLFRRKIYIHIAYDLIIYPFILFDSIRFQIENSKIINSK